MGIERMAWALRENGNHFAACASEPLALKSVCAARARLGMDGCD